MAGDEHDWGTVGRCKLLLDLEAIYIGQFQIQYQAARTVRLLKFEKRGRAFKSSSTKSSSFQKTAQGLTDPVVIVDDKNEGFCCVHNQGITLYIAIRAGKIQDRHRTRFQPSLVAYQDWIVMLSQKPIFKDGQGSSSWRASAGLADQVVTNLRRKTVKSQRFAAAFVIAGRNLLRSLGEFPLEQNDLCHGPYEVGSSSFGKRIASLSFTLEAVRVPG